MDTKWAGKNGICILRISTTKCTAQKSDTSKFQGEFLRKQKWRKDACIRPVAYTTLLAPGNKFVDKTVEI